MRQSRIRQSAANAQALKDKYDAAKKAKAAKQAAAMRKYRADRAAKRAESDKRRKKTILDQMVKTGGPIQGLGHMVDNYSGADLDSLIAISNTPIPREQGESDTATGNVGKPNSNTGKMPQSATTA